VAGQSLARKPPSRHTIRPMPNMRIRIVSFEPSSRPRRFVPLRGIGAFGWGVEDDLRESYPSSPLDDSASIPSLLDRVGRFSNIREVLFVHTGGLPFSRSNEKFASDALADAGRDASSNDGGTDVPSTNGMDESSSGREFLSMTSAGSGEYASISLDSFSVTRSCLESVPS